MKTNNYSPGLIFYIPVSTYFIVGLIARQSEDCFLGYYFKKKYSSSPTLQNVESNIKKEDILLIKITSSLGIEKGKWKILGNWDKFDFRKWPIPVFKKKDPVSDELFLVHYDEMLQQVEVEKAGKGKFSTYPEVGLAGYGFIEKKIQLLLGNS